MSLQHFSHEHPLILTNRELPKYDDDDDGKQQFVCYGCQERLITSTTSPAYYYSCKKCNYFLHKKCAELPEAIKHPKHPQHHLTLVSQPPHEYVSYSCDVCGIRGWKWFTYVCYECEYPIHVSCIPLEERSNEHKFHDHPLIFTQRPALFFCSACGIEGEDLSYRCTYTSCQFWIHDKCASSENTIKCSDHNHPLQLAYSIPYSKRKFHHDCYICKKIVLPNYWVYYCASCTYFAHLKCGKTEEPPSILRPNLDPDLIRVPVPGLMDMMNQFSIDARLIYDEDGRIPCPNGHLEALIDDDVDRKNEMRKKKKEILCDVCAQPISFSSPFSNCPECSFIAHTRCTLFKSQIQQHPSHPQHPLTLAYDNGSMFALWGCDICGRNSNTYLFYCKTSDHFIIDVGCATTFLPSKIKHDAHNHPLILQTPDDRHIQFCKACGKQIANFGMKYACDSSIGCDYKLHTYCAMLPGTLEHDWDKHHMSLTYPPFDHPEDYFCETCEEDIHPSHWLYHCYKCDHSFHTNCAHLHDYWSKVKFGMTYKFENHEHNLTLVRRPKKSRPCENCGDLDRDLPHLDCASCSYHMCFLCALYKAKGKRIN